MNWKFWKKEDDLGLPDLNSFKSDFGKNEFGKTEPAGLDLSAHYEPTNAFSPPPAPTTPQFQTFQQNYPTPAFSPAATPPPDDEHVQQHIQKDLEVIAAKLDTIRAQLEMLNARMANLERDQGPPKRPWY